MKRLGWIGLFALMAVPMAAKVSFGVRAGGSYSSLIQIVDSRHLSGHRMGYNVGGMVDIVLHKRWSLRPELALVYQGGSCFFTRPEGVAVLDRYKYHSLQLPVNLTYTFTFSDVKLSVFAGPVADYALSGRMKSGNAYVSLPFGDADQRGLKPFDLGVSFGVAVEYRRCFFSIHTVSGTLDRRMTRHSGESSVYQNNVTFSLGYLFRH